MHQHFDGDPPQRVERTQDVEGRRGIETEYRLPAIQYYKGLEEAETFRRNAVNTSFLLTASTDIMKIKLFIYPAEVVSPEPEFLHIAFY